MKKTQTYSLTTTESVYYTNKQHLTYEKWLIWREQYFKTNEGFRSCYYSRTDAATHTEMK
jgi:hypothetical protein